MNQNDLFEIPAPKYGSSAVNKNYVDAKITSADLTKVVKKSGDRMSGDLDMDAHFIKNVGINLSDDSTVVPRSYVDSFANSVISNPLTADLNAGDFQIKQLKTPTEDKDAINKKYFEDELLKSHLIPSHRENAFKYLLDQDESSSENTSVLMELLISMEVHIKTKNLIVLFLSKTVMAQMIIDQELESISFLWLLVLTQSSWNIIGRKTQIFN